MYKKVRAKVNLSLNILDKREDGYHNIVSIFQKISLYDEIYVTKTDKHNDINIMPEIPEIKKEENIVFKAYKELKKRFNQIQGIDVILKKNIPMQAGLGGGSSDCGAFIECVDKLYNLNLTNQEKIDIGKKLGADVPATFFDKPVLARGIGEKTEEIDSNFKYYIVVIKPKFVCNTKEMYKKIDEGKEITQKYNSEKIKEALENKNLDAITENLYNVFETAVKESTKIKNDIISAGAKNALLAGSGSCFFGIFEDKKDAKIGYNKLKQKYESYYCIAYSK